MNARWPIGLVCLLAAASVPAAQPTPPAPSAAGLARYTIEQLMASDTFGGLDFSPDNSKLMFTSTRTGAANIYVVELADGGAIASGEPRALTHSKEPLVAIGFFPADERVLYTSDEGGNELSHLYVRELDGTRRDLTPGAEVRARFVQWASDGRSLYAVTNERDGRFFDLYEYQVDGYSRRLVFQNDASYQIRAISPDRRHVALSRIVDNANTHAFLYDTRTRSIKLLTTGPAPIATAPTTFSRDSGALFLVTDEGSEFQYLVRLDLKTGERRTIFQRDWDVLFANLSDDGRYLVLSVNEDARTRIHLLDAKTLQPAPVADLGFGTVEGFELARNKPLAVALVADGDVPGDVHLLDLKTGKNTRVLRGLSASVRQGDLVPGEVARFKSYDGVTIPGVLYVPKGAVARAEPAVVNVHGGPGADAGRASRGGHRAARETLDSRTSGRISRSQHAEHALRQPARDRSLHRAARTGYIVCRRHDENRGAARTRSQGARRALRFKSLSRCRARQRLAAPIDAGRERHELDRIAALTVMNIRGRSFMQFSPQGALKHENGMVTSGGHLSFDQYDQDQVVQLTHSQQGADRWAALVVSDRPDAPLDMELYQKTMALPDGQAKQEEIKRLGELFGGKRRMFVGKDRDRNSAVVLNDAQGRARMRLQVSAGGEASIQFLDENGRVLRTVAATEAAAASR